ncbi:MAG: uncharacterized protein KVP18_000063 [Porospora cf. gigantea A]|uniref:uncharacterized protein n=1 Tax=Porospora cf. gigantea A TaxID=2853593 RepID=UPI003559F2CE|nr:MAG: hypothetical protein KVP18_000063 [Porospora cf. gigantea A]
MKVVVAFLCCVSFAGLGDDGQGNDNDNNASINSPQQIKNPSPAYLAMMGHMDDMNANHGKIADDYQAKMENHSNEELRRLDQRWNDRYGRIA